MGTPDLRRFLSGYPHLTHALVWPLVLSSPSPYGFIIRECCLPGDCHRAGGEHATDVGRFPAELVCPLMPEAGDTKSTCHVMGTSVILLPFSTELTQEGSGKAGSAACLRGSHVRPQAPRGSCSLWAALVSGSLSRQGLPLKTPLRHSHQTCFSCLLICSSSHVSLGTAAFLI